MERLILCGGGHVSLELAYMAARLEFDVRVIDDRPEFANTERFPVGKVYPEEFESALNRLGSGPEDYFAVLTRGHAWDTECVAHILRGSFAYLGMIGSRAKVAAVRTRLTELGFSTEQIDRIHAPIGLNLGGQTPAEIAVSIAAQIVQVFRASPSQSGLERPVEEGLRQLKGPAVLATVLEKSGSSPRGAGTRMLVYPDGTIAGTIGGGALEAAVIREAAERMGKRESYVRDYALTQSGAAALGMVCGGRIRVLLEPLTPA